VEAKDPTQLLGAGGRDFGDGRHRRIRNGGTPAPEGAIPGGGKVTTVGENWTSAAIVTGANLPGQIVGLFGNAEQVTVGSTHGRLITTTLLTVLVLDDGRIAVGPVQPAALEALVAAAPTS
jgi:hypothetical protein